MTSLKAGLVLLTALVLQAAIFSRIGILGAHGDVLVLVPIAAGLTVGPERGATAGFAAGLAVDLLVTTPFGLTALTYCLVGYGVGALQSGMLRATWWLPLVAAISGGAFSAGFFALAGTVIGIEGLMTSELANIAGAVALTAVAAVLPALRIARWVEAGIDRPLAGARL